MVRFTNIELIEYSFRVRDRLESIVKIETFLLKVYKGNQSKQNRVGVIFKETIRA